MQHRKKPYSYWSLVFMTSLYNNKSSIKQYKVNPAYSEQDQRRLYEILLSQRKKETIEQSLNTKWSDLKPSHISHNIIQSFCIRWHAEQHQNHKIYIKVFVTSWKFKVVEDIEISFFEILTVHGQSDSW